MDPEQRVDLVRRGIEAYDAGDLEGALALLHPDVEIYAPPELINAGSFRGRDGFVRWAQHWDDAWESFEQRIDSIEPVGEDHAVAVVTQHAKGAGSGVEVTMTVGQLYGVRDGLCVFFGIYPDPQAAMADARTREGIDAGA